MRMTAGRAGYLYPTKFNFDRAGSHSIRPRLDRRQPPPAASCCQPHSPHRLMLVSATYERVRVRWRMPLLNSPLTRLCSVPTARTDALRMSVDAGRAPSS